MKRLFSPASRANRGSALVAVVIFAVIISICAAFAYRSTIFQVRMADRSNKYLQALNIAEAGGELAMLELNRTDGTGFAGWTGSDPRTLTTTIRDNSNNVVGEAVVQVSSIGSNPRITTTGYVPSRANLELARTVVLTSRQNTVASPWGEFGLFAFGNLKFSGGMSVDSFDPGNPSNSTKKATVGALGNISFYGTQNIYGNVQAGKDLWFDNNSIKIWGNAYYGGSLGYNKNNYPQITGEAKQSSIRTPGRVDVPVAPAKSAIDNNSAITIKPQYWGDTITGIPTDGQITHSNSIITIPAPGNYRLSKLQPSGTSIINIIGSGDVNIFMSGDFNLSSTPTTNIQSADGKTSGPNVTIVGPTVNFTQYGNLNVNGAKLNVFADTLNAGGSKALNILNGSIVQYIAKTLNYDGAAGVNMKNSNTPQDPRNFKVFVSTLANFTAGARASGILYAPDATVNYSGGFDWWGAVIGKDINVTGGPGVKIDQTLFTPSGGSGAFVTAWTEVAPIRL